MKLQFSQQFFENTQISNLIKIRPVGAELFNADRGTDGLTDMTKLIFAFAILRTRLKGWKTDNKLCCILGDISIGIFYSA
jgi:hypothetical protein